MCRTQKWAFYRMAPIAAGRNIICHIPNITTHQLSLKLLPWLSDFQERGLSNIFSGLGTNKSCFTGSFLNLMRCPESCCYVVKKKNNPLLKPYLQEDDDPVLCVLVRCDVEHSWPIPIHDPVVHFGIRSYISIYCFDPGHHRLDRQRLRHRVLIVLWKKWEVMWCVIFTTNSLQAALLHYRTLMCHQYQSMCNNINNWSNFSLHCIITSPIELLAYSV